jgi:hypothetical protein
MSRADRDELEAARRYLDELLGERREENAVRDADRDRRLELEERDAIESPEGEWAAWQRRFRASPPWSRDVHYERECPDRGEVSWPWHGTAS